MNQKRRGMYEKFRVERTDDRDKAGGDREGARYFVLDIDHDPFAPVALEAYKLDATLVPEGKGYNVMIADEGDVLTNNVNLFTKHRGDGSHVERTGSGDDQEYREYMGCTPDNLVAHASNIMAIVFHIVGGTETDKNKQAKECCQTPEAATVAFNLSVMQY